MNRLQKWYHEMASYVDKNENENVDYVISCWLTNGSEEAPEWMSVKAGPDVTEIMDMETGAVIFLEH